jgi:hypothetical protein
VGPPLPRAIPRRANLDEQGQEVLGDCLAQAYWEITLRAAGEEYGFWTDETGDVIRMEE